MDHWWTCESDPEDSLSPENPVILKETLYNNAGLEQKKSMQKFPDFILFFISDRTV